MSKDLLTNEISLRDAGPADEEFLLSVYASTREQEMTLVPWAEDQKAAFVKMQFEAQHTYYHQTFPDADYKVILRGHEPIGRLYVQRSIDTIKVIDLTVIPSHRNHGVGTSLLQQLLAEGQCDHKPVRISVESFNPSQNLFQRLGFSPIAEEGFNYLLEWRPAK